MRAAISEHLRSERNDLHVILGAQLARHRPEDAGADRLGLIVDEDRGVAVEADAAAVGAACGEQALIKPMSRVMSRNLRNMVSPSSMSLPRRKSRRAGWRQWRSQPRRRQAGENQSQQQEQQLGRQGPSAAFLLKKIETVQNFRLIFIAAEGRSHTFLHRVLSEKPQ